MVLVEGVVGRGLLLLLLLQDEDDERADGGLVGKRKAVQGFGGTSKAARATTSKVGRRDMFPMRWWWEWCLDVSERL